MDYRCVYVTCCARNEAEQRKCEFFVQREKSEWEFENSVAEGVNATIAYSKLRESLKEGGYLTNVCSYAKP